MSTYKQLFTTKQNGALTASCKRNLSQLLSRIGEDVTVHHDFSVSSLRKRKVSELLPTERKEQSIFTRENKALIELSDTHSKVARTICKEENPRKKNISSAKAAFTTHTETEYFRYKGQWSGREGNNLIPNFKSYGVVDKTGELLAVIVGEERNVIKAGKGYVWRIDHLGIALVKTSTADEYHPDSSEVLTNFSAIRSALNASAAKRKANKAAIKAKGKAALNKITADMLACETLISLVDSTKNGNCHGGSVAFCRIIGLDSHKQYALGVVAKAAKANISKISDHYLERFLRVASIVLNRKK